jgi:hypothetical protein
LKDAKGQISYLISLYRISPLSWCLPDHPFVSFLVPSSHVRLCLPSLILSVVQRSSRDKDGDFDRYPTIVQHSPLLPTTNHRYPSLPYHYPSCSPSPAVALPLRTTCTTPRPALQDPTGETTQIWSGRRPWGFRTSAHVTMPSISVPLSIGLSTLRPGRDPCASSGDIVQGLRQGSPFNGVRAGRPSYPYLQRPGDLAGWRETTGVVPTPIGSYV